LELCCGTGAALVQCAVRGAVCLGIDISPEAIVRATSRARAAGVTDRCRFVVADCLTLDATQILTAAEAGGLGGAPFDLAFDFCGLQELWAVDADVAATLLAGCLREGAEVLVVEGNANERRVYDGGATSLTCAELVSALPPPAFALVYLRECRFEGEGDPPLAWRACFRRTTALLPLRDTGEDPRASRSEVSVDSRGSATRIVLRRDSATGAPRLLAPFRGPDASAPTVVARRIRGADAAPPRPPDFDSDAIDAALSVDGSVAPSECGSDVTSAFAGADGFENIALSRAAAARAERARAEGDVPWVRWWDRRAAAYDRFWHAQPVLQRRAARIAHAALEWVEVDPARPVVAVDLAAGSGAAAWELARAVRWQGASLRAELVEPSHAMAALARARAASGRLGPRGAATVWQLPVERCAERLPARLVGAADIALCSAALHCLNEHDVFEAAAALLRPGGALVLDLAAEAYVEMPAWAAGAAGSDVWVPAVHDALAAAGQDLSVDVLDVPSRPPPRPHVGAAALAAAAAAAGLRLTTCDVASDLVAGDFFVAARAVSSSWLADSFARVGDSAAASRQARAAGILDAARRAAATRAALATALVVVVKPESGSGASPEALGSANSNNAAARAICALTNNHFV